MHFGEPLPDERFIDLVRLAYDKGIRTFLTADVYGAGEADTFSAQRWKERRETAIAWSARSGTIFIMGSATERKAFPGLRARRCENPAITRATCARPTENHWRDAAAIASIFCSCIILILPGTQPTQSGMEWRN